MCLDNLDSAMSSNLDTMTIATPVNETMVITPLPQITLVISEPYQFRTVRDYLMLWRRYMNHHDSRNEVKYTESENIAQIRNKHTKTIVWQFTTTDVKAVKAYYLIYRLMENDVLKARSYVNDCNLRNDDYVNQLSHMMTPEKIGEANVQQPAVSEVANTQLPATSSEVTEVQQPATRVETEANVQQMEANNGIQQPAPPVGVLCRCTVM